MIEKAIQLKMREQNMRPLFSDTRRRRLFIIGLFLLCSCGTIGQTRRSDYPSDMNGAAVASEISRLETMLADPATGQPSRKDICIQLAFLYSHPNNPRPDIDMVMKYLEMSLGSYKLVDRQYALMLLDTLKQTTAKNTDLSQELIAKQRQYVVLQRKYNALVEENLTNKEIIDQLQNLDIQLEKKRKRTGSR